MATSPASVGLPRRGAVWVLRALVAFAVMVTAERAFASPSSRLVYSRSAEAATCPDEAAVRAAVAARLGYDPFFPWASTTVVVDVERKESGFRAEVKLVDEQGVVRGTRHLETKESECTSLMAAMALTISLVVDPLSLTSPGHPNVEPAEASPEPPPEPPAALVIAPPAKPSPSPRSGPEPIHLFGGVGVLGSLGTAPSLTFGGDVFLGLQRRMFSFELEARGELPSSSASTPAGAVQSERVMGSLVPCLHLGVGLFCAVGSLGWVHASGSDATAQSGSALAGAIGARAGIELKVGTVLRLRAYADLLGELARPELQGTVGRYELPPLSVDLGVAALVRFF
jgi:hypothetical protein